MKTLGRLFAAVLTACTMGYGIDFGSETVKLWHPYLEWTIDDVSYSGNAYDVIATVTFRHRGSNAEHKTEMFYDGSNTWKFRFTGTKTGTWDFSTSSDNADLNGHSGEVSVTSNPDKSITGFLVASGNKFAVQTGENGGLKAISGHIFFPFGMEDGWHAQPHKFLKNLDGIMKKNEKYGFHRYFMSEVCNAWFKLGVKTHDGHSSDEPDPETFKAIEQVIVKLHKNGHSLHIWAWGDEQRKTTPKKVSGGVNGYADRRVQRYIAARLGPLPNWTMGYGFDLQEWAKEDGLKSWAKYLHQRMGWPHLLMARGRSNSELDVRSYSGLCHSYSDAVSNLNRDKNRPHVFEERDLYNRSSCSKMDGTRKLLWQYTLAGGHAGFFGQYFNRNNKAEYPNPEQIKTFFTFWHDNNRLLLDMGRDNDLSNGYCLITPGKTHAVFYKENASSVEMKLSGFNGALSAVAVDTKKDYKEIAVDVTKSNMTWNAPNSSDWAIAVGDFGSGTGPVEPPADDTPPTTPSNLNASAVGKSRIDLSWDAASDDESGVSGYKVYRNGDQIAGSDNTSYSDEGLEEGTEYKYRVSAVNGGGMEGDKSNEASATTGADQDAPRLASVAAQSETSVKVVFNEPVTQASAEETSNYGINGGIVVEGASPDSDEKSVILTTSALALGTSYTLTVSNISDKASTPNTGGDQMDFSFSGEMEITNLTVASGKAYEIVENISEGDARYIDRTFGLESVDDLAGMHYIRTANDDKGETGDDFLSFDVSRAVTVYVAYRHGDDLPPWLSSWSKTGDQVCGDGCSDVYKENFDAGTVTLGGNKPGGAGNMYVVFIGPQGGAATSSPHGGMTSGIAAGVRALHSGTLLRVTGLYPRQEYTITLTDARGRVAGVRRSAGARGTVALSTAHYSGGVYLLNVRSQRHRTSMITVVP